MAHETERTHTPGTVRMLGPRIDDDATVEYNQKCLIVGESAMIDGEAFAPIIAICDNEHNAARLAELWNACSTLPDPAGQIKAMRGAAEASIAKCEQYWNTSGIGDAEVHAVLAFIRDRLSAALTPHAHEKEVESCSQ